MQDYKSPHVTVMVCATLVNTHTHTHSYRQLLTSHTIRAKTNQKLTKLCMNTAVISNNSNLCLSQLQSNKHRTNKLSRRTAMVQWNAKPVYNQT